MNESTLAVQEQPTSQYCRLDGKIYTPAKQKKQKRETSKILVTPQFCSCCHHY